MKNHNILYGVVGLLIGVLVTSSFCLYKNDGAKNRDGDTNEMTHRMSDGSAMEDKDMDMSHTMDSMMSGLEGKTGNEFDEAFLSEMIVHHEGAVVMAQAVLKTSKRPELIKLANEIISAQTKEITMMQDWQKSWFK